MGETVAAAQGVTMDVVVDDMVTSATVVTRKS
jgi:hypothetical protein